MNTTPPGDIRQTDLSRALILAACVVIGLTEWAIFVVGRIGEEGVPAGFWLSALATTALFGVVFEGSAAAIAGATFAGPLVAALWTAPRGDNDGLWILIVPMIAVVAGIGWLAVVVLRRVLPGTSLRRTTRRVIGVHVWKGFVVVLVGATLSLQLLLDRRANPYPRLERLAADFPAPDAVEQLRVRRGGDPLCAGTCRASVETTFTTSHPPSTACEAVEESLEEWKANMRSSAPIYNPQAGYFEVCNWGIDKEGIDGFAAVSDEPQGTIVRLTVLDPRGRGG